MKVKKTDAEKFKKWWGKDHSLGLSCEDERIIRMLKKMAWAAWESALRIERENES